MNNSAATARLAPLLVAAAALLFACGNTAYRFTTETAVLLVALRAASGAVLLTPVAALSGRRERLREKSPSLREAYAAILADRAAWPAVLLCGSSSWTAVLLFSTVDGPLAASVIAVAPVCSLLAVTALGRWPGTPQAVLGVVCTAAALAAGEVTKVGLGVAAICVFFLACDVANGIVVERARARHSAMHLVHLGVLCAAAPAPFLLIGAGGVAWRDVAVVAGITVIGTTGQLLRTHFLPAVGASTAATATQITAFGTALGGIFLFGDDVTARRLILLAIACTAAVAALSLGRGRTPSRSVTHSAEPLAGLAAEETGTVRPLPTPVSPDRRAA